MQVVYHLGAHCTDEDNLLRCLLKNKDDLERNGVIIPRPGRYRHVLQGALNTLKGQPAPEEFQKDILGAILDAPNPKRLFLSSERFAGMAPAVLSQNRIYPMLGEHISWLRNLFPQAEPEFFIAIRNPATFAPALFERSKEDDFPGFIQDVVPNELRWSDTLTALRDNAKGCRIVAWAYEDSPLIWTDVLAAMAKFPPSAEIRGVNDFLGLIMSQEGVLRLVSYLTNHPIRTPQQRQRVITAFLDKYALPDAIEMELDMPGWSQDLIDELTANYVADCQKIATMEGIEFIQP